MRKLSVINEDIFNGIQRRDSDRPLRKEDNKEHNKLIWRTYIALPNGKKYPKSELNSIDIAYNVIDRIKKSMDSDDDPEEVNIYFKYDGELDEVWTMQIYHTSAYGLNTYNISLHSINLQFNQEKYSSLGIDDKRGIKQRLDERTFYIYRHMHNGEIKYELRENTPEYKSIKGILLI